MTDTLQLAHFSVKEYLTSKRIQDGSASGFYLETHASHHTIAQMCLIYLLQFDKEGLFMPSDALSRFPLAQYAAVHWAAHTQFGHGCTAGELCGLIIKLFEAQSAPYINWVQIFKA